MPKVSVVLPTYNRAYVLPEAIDSVLNQTFVDLELIIVDDGSTDDTAHVVGSYTDSRIRVLKHVANRGYSAALNTGVRAATGELLAFEDSDDLWMPDKISKQVEFLAGHPDLGGVFSDLVLIRGTQRFESMLRLYPVFSRFIDQAHEVEMVLSQREIYLCLLEEEPVKLQASVFRLDRVHNVGLFEESWRSGSDWEFSLRFARANALGFIDRALTTQRTLSDSTLVRHKKEDAQCLMERFIKEERTLQGDSQALAAVRRGIAHHATELGSCFLDEGDHGSAAKAYWRGFAHSGNFGLLLRCPAAMLPHGARVLVKRFKNAQSY